MTLDRRSFIGVSATTAAALAMNPLRLLAQQSAPSNFTEIRKSVGTFVGQGGTIGWYLGKGGAVVIDSQFPRTAEPCLKGLKERSTSGLSMLINTHHHGDHTGGNAVFKSAVKKIVAHENVPILQKKQATEGGKEAGQVYADTTFAKTWREKLDGETVAAKYYGPAHTGGDAVIHFENANVAHTGDLVFNRIHPFIDFPGGGTILGWIDVLQDVHDDLDKDTVVIFGHGSPKQGITGTRKDVLVMRDYFQTVVQHIEKGKKKGATKEEILASTLGGFEDYTGNARMSIAVTIERTYEDLERGGVKKSPKPKG